MNISKLKSFGVVAILVMLASGCGLQKVAALPFRVTGAVVSVVPVVGDAAHGVFEATADVID